MSTSPSGFPLERCSSRAASMSSAEANPRSTKISPIRLRLVAVPFADVRRAGARRRLLLLLELGPLLRQHARELDAGDVELRDEDLAQQVAALGLQLEGALELLGRQKPAFDEQGADEARLQDRSVTHARSIGNPSFGL
jgi:hypothetical protein